MPRVPVAAVRSVGPTAVAVELATPAGFTARPGQFVELATTADGERVAGHYTVSSPACEDTFELTVDVDPAGDLSPRLRSLTPGDEVVVDGPYGTAFYDGESSVLALAGGVGVGAALGVAERALAEGGQAALVYRGDALIHEARLAALAAAGAPVWVLARTDSLAPAVAAAMDGRRVFVYGYADFLAAATDAVGAAGGEPAAAKIENYG